MINLVSDTSVTIAFTPEEKKILKISSEKNTFDEGDLISLSNVIQNVLDDKNSDWSEFNILDKTWYYFDHWQISEKTRGYCTRVICTDLIKRINRAAKVLGVDKMDLSFNKKKVEILNTY